MPVIIKGHLVRFRLIPNCMGS